MSGEPETDALPENHCWQLLRDHEVGRLAVVLDGHPEIFPVNFVVDHGTIVFRSAPGSKLDAIADRAPVAFEIDGQTGESAYSVVVKGTAVAIGDRDELFGTFDLPLFPWQAGPKPRFVRVLPQTVTGRRFSIADRRALHTSDPRPRPAPPD